MTIASLADIAASPSTVTIKGVSYDLAPLSLADLAAAERFIIDQRADAQLKQAGRIPMQPQVLAAALAEIQCRPCSWLRDVVGTAMGTAKLIELSMRKAAKNGAVIPSAERIAADLADSLDVLADIVFSITGLTKKTEGDESPFPGTESPVT